MEVTETKNAETQETKENPEVKEGEETKEKVSLIDVIKKNPAVLVPMVSAAGMIFKGVLGIICNLTRKDGASCYVKDDITGLNYLCEHPLNNTEILELSARKQNGDSTGEALLGMDVLKHERRRK